MWFWKSVKDMLRTIRTSTEQKKSGVFPLVVWIVPDASRKESLKRNISESQGLKLKEVFLVITSEELENFILNGGI